jgi:hypothetical protein
MTATFITRGHVALPFPSAQALAAWLVTRAAGAPIELLPQRIAHAGTPADAPIDALAVFTRRPVTSTDARGRTITTMADVWHGWATDGAADPVALQAAIDALTTPASAETPALAALPLAGAA